MNEGEFIERARELMANFRAATDNLDAEGKDYRTFEDITTRYQEDAWQLVVEAAKQT